MYLYKTIAFIHINLQITYANLLISYRTIIISILKISGSRLVCTEKMEHSGAFICCRGSGRFLGKGTGSGCEGFPGVDATLVIKALMTFQVTPDCRNNVDTADQHKVILLTCYLPFNSTSHCDNTALRTHIKSPFIMSTHTQPFFCACSCCLIHGLERRVRSSHFDRHVQGHCDIMMLGFGDD